MECRLLQQCMVFKICFIWFLSCFSFMKKLSTKKPPKKQRSTKYFTSFLSRTCFGGIISALGHIYRLHILTSFCLTKVLSSKLSFGTFLTTLTQYCIYFIPISFQLYAPLTTLKIADMDL